MTTDKPKWPQNPRPRTGAPNVIVFLTDDVGFGACSTFGGPIETPCLDRLAGKGVRFTQFHTTAMCSPTRASLLTGRNPHRVSMGRITNRPSYYDGYTSVIPKSAGTVANILRKNGYTTGMFGKGHVTPEWEMSQLGPFDRWPTGMGFDYFYGFLGYDTNMWAPNLVENTSFIEPDHSQPPRHFEELMAQRAIDWISQQRTLDPDKPFFAYYATGTAHSPHHAPAEWLTKYRGRFDQGWDALRTETFERQKAMGVVPQDCELTSRPDALPAWDSLPGPRKLLASRLMEAYAAALDHVDHQIGKVLDALDDMGELDNTLVIFVQGDNGGSAEGGFNGLLFEHSWLNGFDEDLSHVLAHIDDIGGPAAYNHFPAAWGWAMNTPFQYYKQVASHFGGTRNGLVMSWPRSFGGQGEVRAQFHFVSDLMPTILEAAGIEPPDLIDGVAQDPLDGISMLYAAANASAPPRRTRQVFECLENFGIYHEGWFAATHPASDPWEGLANRKPSDPDNRDWELYHIAQDFSQATDLSGLNPGKLEELKDLFWIEARENKMLPIHAANVGTEGRPSVASQRKSFVYRRGMQRVHVDAAPHTVGKSFSIRATVAVGNNASGVIVCHGSCFGGYALYMQDGLVIFHYNAIEPCRHHFASSEKLSAGQHQIVVDFVIDEPKPGSGGLLTVRIDEAEVSKGRMARTLRSFANLDGFNVGCDTVSPVGTGYCIDQSKFSGELARVEILLA